MRAALISLGSTSSQWVADAMGKYFDHVDMLQLRNIEVTLGRENCVLYNGEPIAQYDCVYLKGSFRYANLLRSIASMLEGKVPYMPLPADSFTITHNKLLTHLALQQHNIAMPKTYISPTAEAAKILLTKVNYPIVMKFPEGTQGKGVMFADSFSSASSLLDALGALNQPFIIQEYVETGGTDIRALVVGDKVVAAMRRRAQTNEKRANLHAGGVAEPMQLDRDSIALALDCAKALKAEVCGVDILVGPLGPTVIEANISPGLQGLQEVSTIDVADQIARYMFDKTKQIVEKKHKLQVKEVMKEIRDPLVSEKIVTRLTFRGSRILLPDFVAKMAQLSDRKEYAIKAKKGRVEIEEFDL